MKGKFEKILIISSIALWIVSDFFGAVDNHTAAKWILAVSSICAFTALFIGVWRSCKEK